jgi:TP901 family phage tail tape measure protein
MADFKIRVNASLNQASKAKIQKDLDKIGKSSSANLNKTNTGMKDLNKNLEKASQGFGDISLKILQWTAATTAVFSLIRGMKDLVVQVKNLDSAMLELAKVTDLTDSELNNLTKSMIQLGESTGRTLEETIDAYAEFARAGFDIKSQVPILAEYALVMTNVADGITETSDAAGVLISIIKGFGLEAEEASRITDVLNQISNNTAISFDALADIMSRSSAVVAQTGTSLEELASIGTSAYEVLRDSSKVGSALNTISLRLRGLDQDGENVAGLVSELEESFKNLAGVDITDANGQLLSTFEIIEKLAPVWEQLDGNTQSYIAELAGGKRQASVFLSILNNYDTVTKSLNEGLNSQNSALEENAKFLDSVEGKINKLSSAWQQLAQNTVSSDTLKWFIDFGTATIKLVDGIGLLNIALLTTVGYLAMTGKLLIPLPGMFLATSISVGKFATSLGLSAGAASALATAMAALWPLLIAGGIIVGVKALTFALDALVLTNDELNESVKESFNTMQESSKNLDTLIDKYKQLKEVENLTANQKVEMMRIERELSQRYGITNDILEDQEELTLALLKAKKLEMQVTLEQTRANYMEAKSRISVLKASQEQYLQLIEQGDANDASIRFFEDKISLYQDEINSLEDTVNLWDAQKGSLEDIWQYILDIENGVVDIKDNEEGITKELKNQSVIIKELNEQYELAKKLSEERIENLQKEIDALNGQKEEVSRRREDEELTNKILEARQRLLNAETQRNVWTFMGEDMGWQLTADPRAVREATAELDEQLKAQQELQEDRKIEDAISALETEIEKEKSAIEKLREAIEKQIQTIKDNPPIANAVSKSEATSESNADAEANVTVNGTKTSSRTRAETEDKINDEFRPGQSTGGTYIPGQGGAITDPVFDLHGSNVVPGVSGNSNMEGGGIGNGYTVPTINADDIADNSDKLNNGKTYNFYDTNVKADNIQEFIRSLEEKVI